MCELLVKALDAHHHNPDMDRAGCYKRGDVVVIMPDGHDWGAGELNTSVFDIIKMPGVPVADMQYLLNEEIAPIKRTAAMYIPALRQHEQKQPRETITRKRYKIDLTTQQITDKTRL